MKNRPKRSGLHGALGALRCAPHACRYLTALSHVGVGPEPAGRCRRCRLVPGPRPLGLHGFTIFELLAVITVLAVLLTLVLPALMHARETAKRAVCAGNVRHIGVALRLYAVDFKSIFPTSTMNLSAASRTGAAWWGLLGRPRVVDPCPRIITAYMGLSTEAPVVEVEGYRVFSCPSEVGDRKDPPGTPNHYEWSGTSYAYMAAPWRLGETVFSGTPIELSFAMQGCWGARVSKIANASMQVLAIELGWVTRVGEEEFAPDDWSTAYSGVLPHDPVEPIMNMCFVDGHVRFLKLQPFPNHYYDNGDYEFTPPP